MGKLPSSSALARSEAAPQAEMGLLTDVVSR